MIDKVSSGIESYIQQASRTVLETKLIDQRIEDKQLNEKATQSVSVEISQKARSMVKQDLIDDKLTYSKFRLIEAMVSDNAAMSFFLRR